MVNGKREGMIGESKPKDDGSAAMHRFSTVPQESSKLSSPSYPVVSSNNLLNDCRNKNEGVFTQVNWRK